MGYGLFNKYSLYNVQYVALYCVYLCLSKGLQGVLIEYFCLSCSQYLQVPVQNISNFLNLSEIISLTVYNTCSSKEIDIYW